MLIFLDRVVHTHEHDATLRGSFTAVEFQVSLFSIKKTTRIERFHCAEYHLAWTNYRNYIDTEANCHLKKFTCKGTFAAGVYQSL